MSIKKIKNLKCLVCGKEYSAGDLDYVCPDHGTEGILDVQYDYSLIAEAFKRDSLQENRNFTIWRYEPLLPVADDANVPPLEVGWTPMYRSRRLEAALELDEIHVKDDGRQPTASFKDRASAIAVVKAGEKKAEVMTTASTGNAAAALSGLCASTGQKNVIFVPESAPQAKIAQLLVFGSTVVLVKGSYDQAFEMCLYASETYGWYNRNTGFNPYMTEGKKTVAYEICEQLNWQAPDYIFVSVGDGCIIGGVHKGLKDLLILGWIDKMPKLMGVQSFGSNYLHQAWKNGEDVLTKPALKPSTIADSISTGIPRDRIKALAAVKETGGAFIQVSDAEILHAVTALARGCGVFAEPAGAAAYAGLVHVNRKKNIDKAASIVVINTGNGLKDIPGALKAVKSVQSEPIYLSPEERDLKPVFADLERKPSFGTYQEKS